MSMVYFTGQDRVHQSEMSVRRDRQLPANEEDSVNVMGNFASELSSEYLDNLQGRWADSIPFARYSGVEFSRRPELESDSLRSVG